MRIIYVNGWFDRLPPESEDKSMFTLWGSEPVDICDGGEIAFGVEFEIQTEMFKNFHFNSALEPRL